MRTLVLFLLLIFILILSVNNIRCDISNVIPNNIILSGILKNLKNDNKSGNIEFIENKGQIIDKNDNGNVLYYIHIPNAVIFFKKDQISFTFFNHRKKLENTEEIYTNNFSRKILNPKPFLFEIYRVDMVFNNSKTKLIYGLDTLPDYCNFYTSNNLNGITNVRKFKKVFFENIYDNIDLIFYENKDGFLQYDFIVKPGGNLNDINISFKGNNDIIANDDGNLIIKTPLYYLEHTAPFTYQDEPIPSSFMLNKDLSITFNVKNYDINFPLVIDPTIRLWGTYFGGTVEEVATDIVCDKENNIYVLGWTASRNQIASEGAHQTTFAGVYDTYIAKFSSNGQRIWSTYYGGAGIDRGTSIAIDDNKNIFICGYTNSSRGDTIATDSAHQRNFGRGNYDAYLVKFDSNGIRQWGTYYGGNGDDRAFGVATDKYGNIFMCGLTSSRNAIATQNAYKIQIDSTDAFLVKFNSDGVRQWGTYFGGENIDCALGLGVDSFDNVYMCGYTNSQNRIATENAFQKNYQGENDAFIVKFSNDGNLLWGSYFGSIKNDEASDIVVNNEDYIYICGTTTSEDNISSENAHQMNFGGYIDAFLVKFDTQGEKIWSTYYGGLGEDRGIKLATDKFNNVYLCGYTDSPNQISNAGSYQSAFEGNYDAFLVKFNNNGIRQWCTYYGDYALDEGLAITTDVNGNIFLWGDTYSEMNIATEDTHQPILGGDKDAFLVKFSGTYLPTPILEFPRNQQVDVSINPKLEWKEIPDIMYYKLQISTEPDFSEISFEKNNIVDNSYQLEGLNYSTTYYWRINATDGIQISDWSDEFSFTTQIYTYIHDEIVLKENEMIVSPNPLSSASSLIVNIPFDMTCRIIMYDINGKVVKTFVNGYYKAGTYTFNFSTENLSSGIYNLLLISETKILNSRKVIIYK